MVFSSSIFMFLFLPVLLLLYFLNKNITYRNIVLLIMSIIFYAWGEPKYVLVMLLSILVNYGMGLLLDKTEQKKKEKLKKGILFLAVFCNLGILFVFKYLNFVEDTINRLLRIDLGIPDIALPIGISFFTFQGMTYVIDLYRGTVGVQKNPMKLALYISLFPQLIAGPIVRYADICEEIDHRTVKTEDLEYGIKRFIVGLSQKVIIANTLGAIADEIFAQNYSSVTVPTAWLGIVCYTAQIYFDFSGYSSMAIGLGRIFGFHFCENFNLPYKSKSITEFWRRWHISLSSFFRDYLYIPMGGSRRGNVYFHLFVVFLCTGIWHGASWNFIVWGLWHGIFMLTERSFRGKDIRIPAIFKHIYTMLVVMIGWVFFRADNLRLAGGYLKSMFGLNQVQNVLFDWNYYLNYFSVFILVLAVIFSVVSWNWDREYKMKKVWMAYAYQITVNTVLLGLFIFSIMVMLTSTYNPFIYFRF